MMFLEVTDLDGDGHMDILATTRNGKLLFFRRTEDSPAGWQTHDIPLPWGYHFGKSVRAGDIDLDGKSDLVLANRSGGNGAAPSRKSNVAWLHYEQKPTEANWRAEEISGREGEKFDLMELVDLDGDGDLDVLTCEERENLGVVWYENPTWKGKP